MSLQSEGWICFALRDEARPLIKRSRSGTFPPKLLISGIGRRNADRAIRRGLERARHKPRWLVTCGFAGGLKPGLASGDVLGSHDPAFVPARGGGDALVWGARFFESNRVVVTAEEKQRLHQTTGADAVEMESTVIRSICSELGIPCATVRVVLDTAEEDLPLDFNRYFREDLRLDLVALSGALIRSPRRLWGLIKLQRRSRRCARQLAHALMAIQGISE